MKKVNDSNKIADFFDELGRFYILSLDIFKTLF